MMCEYREDSKRGVSYDKAKIDSSILGGASSGAGTTRPSQYPPGYVPSLYDLRDRLGNMEQTAASLRDAIEFYQSTNVTAEGILRLTATLRSLGYSI